MATGNGLLEALNWVESTGALPPWAPQPVWDSLVAGGFLELCTCSLAAIMEMTADELRTWVERREYRLTLEGWKLRHQIKHGETLVVSQFEYNPTAPA